MIGEDQAVVQAPGAQKGHRQQEPRERGAMAVEQGVEGKEGHEEGGAVLREHGQPRQHGPRADPGRAPPVHAMDPGGDGGQDQGHGRYVQHKVRGGEQGRAQHEEEQAGARPAGEAVGQPAAGQGRDEDEGRGQEVQREDAGPGERQDQGLGIVVEGRVRVEKIGEPWPALPVVDEVHGAQGMLPQVLGGDQVVGVVDVRGLAGGGDEVQGRERRDQEPVPIRQASGAQGPAHQPPWLVRRRRTRSRERSATASGRRPEAPSGS